MIGDLIQERLEAKGWNQSQLSINAGLSQAYISKLIRGQVKLPNQATLTKIGKQLGISLGEFYKAAGILTPETSALPAEDNLLVLDVVPYVETWSDLAAQLKQIREKQPQKYEALVDYLQKGWRAQVEGAIGMVRVQSA